MAALETTDVPMCFLCGEQGKLLYAGQSDRLFGCPGSWSVLRCPLCSMLWLNPQPRGEDIARLYADYCTHAPRSQSMQSLVSRRARLAELILPAACGYTIDGAPVRLIGRLLARISSVRDIAAGTVMWLPAQQGRLLDVGCGSGEFLHTMRGLGWDVLGVEPDPKAAQFARERFGVPVLDGTIATADLPESAFDAVTLSHVIEHVPDPVELLSACRRVLSPAGRLVVATPNAQSLGHKLFGSNWRGLEVPRHLVVFSRAALSDVAARADLKVESLRTSVRGAAWMAIASLILKQRGSLPGGTPQKLTGIPLLWGLLFHLVEEAVNVVSRDRGEELVLIASKL